MSKKISYFLLLLCSLLLDQKTAYACKSVPENYDDIVLKSKAMVFGEVLTISNSSKRSLLLGLIGNSPPTEQESN